ncbi:hypothetical protein D3C87_1782910 [compost metagenome]
MVLTARKAADVKDFADSATLGRALDRDDQIDCISDNRLHRLMAGLGGQLFEALEC